MHTTKRSRSDEGGLDDDDEMEEVTVPVKTEEEEGGFGLQTVGWMAEEWEDDQWAEDSSWWSKAEDDGTWSKAEDYGDYRSWDAGECKDESWGGGGYGGYKKRKTNDWGSSASSGSSSLCCVYVPCNIFIRTGVASCKALVCKAFATKPKNLCIALVSYPCTTRTWSPLLTW